MSALPPSPADPTAPKPARPAATIHEVARLAGVAIITVSRSFTQPGKLSPGTLSKVREAVARTGYVPNRAAGTLRLARSGFVAVLVPTLKGQNFSGLIEGLTTTLAEHGHQVLIGEVGYSGPREDDLLRSVIGRRPDGIVITGVMHSAEGRALLAQSGIPVVETWDVTPTPVDMLVGASHEAIGYAACTYLARRGRRRLAHVGGDDERAARRARSFVQAASHFGLEAPVLHTVRSPSTHADGRLALGELLARRPDIDAICCGSDPLAMGVMTEARVRGLAVPDRLAVMGSGDSEYAATHVPSLTSIRIDGLQAGRIAARLVLDRLQGVPIEHKVVDLGFEIVERESA
ncbi:LacI family DNA-binding transcriptional regulator [Aquincola sp. MAHUQ-54]|uniref:LacI family DNA-binding transcriptional regulator n=1 Tax=Aquincola agrisoli TaxID=3119538 RepID=A0AAW9Q130_9BURK